MHRSIDAESSHMQSSRSIACGDVFDAATTRRLRRVRCPDEKLGSILIWKSQAGEINRCGGQERSARP
jgi:hypothetical protein